MNDFDNLVKKVKGLYPSYGFLIAIMILIFFLIYRSYSREKYLVQAPYFVTQNPIKTVCYHGFSSILKEDVDKSMFSKSIIKTLDQNGYSFFDFKESSTIKHVKDLDHSCQIILEDKIGLRSFILKFIESSDSNHFFGMVFTDITENQITDFKD